jgi:chemotaxis response regulator CheB
VQHITSGFLERLVTWLAASLSLPVKLAQDGELLAAGCETLAVILTGMGDDELGLARDCLLRLVPLGLRGMFAQENPVVRSAHVL